MLVTIHATIEEWIFYPVSREAGVETNLLDEAEVEHASAKDLVAQIRAMSPDDDPYDAKVTVLGEYMDHHVQRSRTSFFLSAARGKIDLEERVQQWAER